MSHRTDDPSRSEPEPTSNTERSAQDQGGQSQTEPREEKDRQKSTESRPRGKTEDPDKTL